MLAPPFEINDPAQLARLREALKDDDAHFVLTEFIGQLKAIVERAQAMGCNLFGNRLRPNLAIEMWFENGQGAQYKARISFKKPYEERSGKPLSDPAALALQSAVATLVLNSDGMKPLRR